MLGFRAGRKVSDEHNAPGISGGLQTRSGRSGNQQQGVLLPEYLDDYVLEENPVRVVDAFIDELDLEAPVWCPSRRVARPITRRYC
jgi:hypothetical protein